MSFNSNIILVKNIKMDKKYRNVLSYSETEMLELCRANKSIELTKYSFIRDKKQSIKVEYPYDACLACNYIAFQNTDYSGKWFFAFIDRVNYLSNAVTEIEYTVDIWSTWFSYWTPQTCYVNREHVNDDTIGLHTIPENIDVGEVIQESTDTYTSLTDDYYFIMLCTYDLITNRNYSNLEFVNGNLFSSMIYIFDTATPVDMQNCIQDIAEKADINNIRNIFIAPKFLVDNLGIRKIEGNGGFRFIFILCFRFNNRNCKRTNRSSTTN